MDTGTNRTSDRGGIQFTTAFFEASKDAVYKELFFIITGGHKPGKTIKEEEEDAKH